MMLVGFRIIHTSKPKSKKTVFRFLDTNIHQNLFKQLMRLDKHAIRAAISIMCGVTYASSSSCSAASPPPSSPADPEKANVALPLVHASCYCSSVDQSLRRVATPSRSAQAGFRQSDGFLRSLAEWVGLESLSDGLVFYCVSIKPLIRDYHTDSADVRTPLFTSLLPLWLRRQLAIHCAGIL